RRVSGGDLDAKVSAVGGPGDLQTLARAFNRMTSQLKEQRNALVSTNQQLDERRRFTEAVLAGVSAGIIGIDPSGRISLVNRYTLHLTGLEEPKLIGEQLDAALPAFALIFEQASSR